MRKGGLLLILLAVILESSSGAHAQSSALKTAMHQKVADAERLLQPIVTGDFELIDRYSERLSHISLAEITSWHARPEPAYSERASTFLKAVQRLRRAAMERNADEALEGYTALITSCANCHTYVQRTRPIVY